MPPGQNRKLDEEIDRNLRRAFQDLVNEPVPDRFKDLLKRLEETDAAHQPVNESDTDSRE